MSPQLRTLLFWGFALFMLFSLFNAGTNTDINMSEGVTSTKEVPYTAFVQAIENAQMREISMEGDAVRGITTDGTLMISTQPANSSSIAEAAVANNVPLYVLPEPTGGFGSLLFNLLPIFLLIAFWLFMMRRMQGGPGGIGSFGKSKTKLLTEHHGKVTFNDVAGIDEAKEELEEIVDFLRNPDRFSRLGAKIPKGALLVGPPGTGKTLLARAIAGEAGVPFFSTSGSDFVEMFVGVGASRVRDMFEQAKKNAPCIIFIDEIDAVGRTRGVGIGGGNDEREQTLNQILVEMDGFEANEGIIIIAATNRPDVLDPALLRPGRFDRQVQVPNPDVKGREAILNVHARKIPLGPNVDLRIIARGTPGFSGADLANLVNESALAAARVNKRLVTMEDFEKAKDKIMLGAERRSLVMSEDEKKLTAYHEAGHAVVGLHVPQHDPIHKATIVPRGRALGLVLSLPERDQLSVTYTKYKSKIAMAMGGKVAEELIFGSENVTSGAMSDIEQVTRIARAMVTQFGFDREVGNINYVNRRDSYLGSSESGVQASDETQRKIEEAVRKLIEEGYETAKRILTEESESLHNLAQGLLEYETLTGDEINRVMRGEPIKEDDSKGPPPSAPSIFAGVPKTRKAPPPSGGGAPAV